MSDLPRRVPPAPVSGSLWLPVLSGLVNAEPLFYRLGVAGPRGKARLRAWRTPDDGRFVVLAHQSGLAVAEVDLPLRGMLAERFGQPFALAELLPGRADLILPPAWGRPSERLRLFPAEDGPCRAALDEWWAVYGDTVLSC
jgi:hypothetical protein